MSFETTGVDFIVQLPRETWLSLAKFYAAVLTALNSDVEADE